MSWALWGLASLVPPSMPFRILAFLPGTIAPAFVAWWLTSPEQRPALVNPAFKWQVPARWYLFALLYLAVIKLVAAIVYRIMSGTWPAMVQEPWFAYFAATVIFTPVQAGEEIGWRGYALPRLTQRFGLGAAAILLGIIWAAWHLPLFFVAATDTTGQSFPVYALSVTAISVAIAWLYARTGSLLLAMLMHAAVNNTPHFVPPVPTGKVFAMSATLLQWLTLLGLWIGAGYLLFKMRKHKTFNEPIPTAVS
ncbi:MAG: lysostaphin resistance A-like protein [Gemmatimonadales bacterium]